MKQATFYILNHDIMSNGLTSVECLACDFAAANWREGKRVLIACENNIQALRLDEALWVRDPYAFVPHNLAGEGPSVGAPVELCWPPRYSNTLQDILISLLSTYVDFAANFHQVIEFVPNKDTLKQMARNRYKAYRSIGFQLTIVKLLTN